MEITEELIKNILALSDLSRIRVSSMQENLEEIFDLLSKEFPNLVNDIK